MPFASKVCLFASDEMDSFATLVPLDLIDIVVFVELGLVGRRPSWNFGASAQSAVLIEGLFGMRILAGAICDVLGWEVSFSFDIS
ncbi:hypothetical protein ACLOJK_006173 [Asimina triloba]